MNNSEFETLLTRLPSLRTLLEKCGNISIFEYAKRYIVNEVNLTDLQRSRKDEFVDFISDYAGKKIDAAMGEKVRSSLTKNYAVSTAEHHGPMGHPFFFQSAILRGLVNPDDTVVNLCTSHVSIGNSSYPRGLIFHGEKEHTLPLPFFPSYMRMCPVFHLPAYTRDTIEKSCLRRLQGYFLNGEIKEETYEIILSFINTYVLDENILARKTYSEQITLLNHSWWESLFPTLPDFIPLDSEDIICELLLKHLKENTFLANMITNQSMQENIEKNFDGISCCFNFKQKSGTYLFWYLDSDYRRHALWRQNDELVSNDGSFKIQMRSETISHHLTQRDLIPSGLLVYTIFACYYGITCFGGFAQGDYLPHMQEAYKRLLKNIGGDNEGMLSHQEPILNEDMIFLHEEKGSISSALDLEIRGTNTFLDILKKAQATPLAFSIKEMIPEIIRCL